MRSSTLLFVAVQPDFTIYALDFNGSSPQLLHVYDAGNNYVVTHGWPLNQATPPSNLLPPDDYMVVKLGVGKVDKKPAIQFSTIFSKCDTNKLLYKLSAFGWHCIDYVENNKLASFIC